MGIAAAIVGVVGGLSAVMGILTILEIDLGIGSEFTWMFWLVLAGVLLQPDDCRILQRGKPASGESDSQRRTQHNYRR
jgi:hypothetical protein